MSAVSPIATTAAAQIRTRRERLGVSVEALADRVGLCAAQVVELEAGRWPAGLSGYEVSWLAACLHLDASHLLGVRDPEPIAALEVPATAWRFRPDLLGALLQARRVWLDDTRIDPPARHPLGAGACEVRLERRTPPRTSDPYAGASLVLAATARARTTLADGPYVLAQRLGVPVGRAPLPDGVRGVVLDAHGWVLVELSSTMAPAVRRRSCAHLLGHLLAGDVTAALVDVVEDLDDDSIFSCAGTGAPACQRATVFADALCGSPRAPGTAAARAAAGVRHDDLLIPGGDDRVVDPSAVLRRRVAAIAAGMWVPEELRHPDRFVPDPDLADERHPPRSALDAAAAAAPRSDRRTPPARSVLRRPGGGGGSTSTRPDVDQNSTSHPLMTTPSKAPRVM